VASIRAGDDPKTVSGNLGHASVAFTLDVYGHVTGDMKKDSSDRMQEYIEKLKK
jgi:integrase